MYFSNVSFLNSVKSSSRSKLTIKQWLALICRLLAFAFLVVTFAMPFVAGDLTVNSSADRVIYLDDSFSNSNISADGLTAFDNSSQRVLQFLEQFSPEDKFMIKTNSSSSRSPQAPDQVRDLVSEVALTSNRKSLNSILENSARAVNYSVFSDFQKNQFQFDDFLRDTLNTFYFFPASYEINKNVFVDSVFLENPILNEAVVNQLTIRLRNTGAEAVNDLPVFFTVNSVQVSSNSVDIAPDAYTDLKIDISNLDGDVNNCMVNFEDFPVTFDNNFYFTLVKTREIRILEIADAQSTDYIKEVYESDLFRYTVQDVTNINYSLLESVDFLVLNQLTRFDANFITVLREFLRNGGSLLLIPAENFTDTDFLSMITGGGVQVRDPGNSQKQVLAKPSGNNPFFLGVFEDKNVQIDQVEASGFFNWRHGENILSFRNDLPFLTRFANGKGSVYLLNSSLNKTNSGFAESSLFLPIMYKLAFSGLDRRIINLYSRTDANAILWKGEAPEGDRVYKLKKGDQEIIPPQRQFNGQVSFNIGQLGIEPGFWSVCNAENECFGVLAINEVKSESMISQYSFDELTDLTEEYDNIFVFDTEKINLRSSDGLEDLGNKYFWKYSLLLVLLFFFAEVLILRFL